MFGNSSIIYVTDDLSNCGEAGGGKPACNTGSFATGGSSIYVTPAVLLGQARFSDTNFPDSGELIDPVKLLVHEFAHYFTNPVCSGDPPCGTDFNSEEPTFNFLYFGNAQRVERGDVAAEIESFINIGRNPSNHAEASADIITNWVYGTNFTTGGSEIVQSYIEGIVAFCIDPSKGCGP